MFDSKISSLSSSSSPSDELEDEDERMHIHGRYTTWNRNTKAPPQTNGSSSKPLTLLTSTSNAISLLWKTFAEKPSKTQLHYYNKFIHMFLLDPFFFTVNT
jgi:hypothetical protein